MSVCIIDGKEYEFNKGETVIQVADRHGIDIPRFCYHPSLSVVAQCRMCAVEIEKMPKIQTACSTPVGEGMVIHTKSPKVKEAQASCMEFLLINHPLDCPICDEAGECELQNTSFKYGSPDSRYDEYRRTYLDLDMGPVIKKNMNRCIHCTRCIRFCDEVSGYREMVAMKRGNHTEITTVDGRPLETEYAGNLADICPTGSLTLKDFRFRKRVWYLKKTDSVCDGCSQGCNIELHQDRGKLFRMKPRENMEINKWWICDEGRFGFHYVHNADRVTGPLMGEGTGKSKVLVESDWFSAVEETKKKLKGKVLVLVGTDNTVEEMEAIQAFSKQFKDVELFHYGTEGHTKASDDKEEDKILKRTNKTSNLHGAEKLGIKGWSGRGQFQSAILFNSGRAKLSADLKKAVKGLTVGVGVFNKKALAGFDIVLPGLSFAEKDGTVVNWQGKDQKIKKAIEPVGDSKGIMEILELWKKAVEVA